MLEAIRIRPSDELLKQHSDINWWEEAVKQAQRSTFKRHKTGAVVIDQRGNARATGCSHKRDGYAVNSIHAEQHAISNLYDTSYRRQACLIVTLTRVGNFANCSRPCYDCAYALQHNGIDAMYAERTNDGGWAIRYVPFDVLTVGYLKPTKYA